MVDRAPNPALALMTPARPIVAVSTVAPLCMTAIREIDVLDLLPGIVQHHAPLERGRAQMGRQQRKILRGQRRQESVESSVEGGHTALVSLLVTTATGVNQIRRKSLSRTLDWPTNLCKKSSGRQRDLTTCRIDESRGGDDFPRGDVWRKSRWCPE